MTTITSVVLVDKRIQDHETIVAAVKADGVRCIVFDVAVIEAQASSSSSSSTSFEYILGEIAALGAGSFTNIGIVQHNTGAPFHRFFAQTQGEMSTVAGVETDDPTLQTWAGFAGFVSTLKNTYGVQNVDLMACALYSDPNWKYIIDTLAVQTGVTLRASTDDTGAAALGGDWFLESHTGVNLKDVYFTEAIEEFRGVLIYSTKYDSSSFFTPKSIAVGKATAWGATGYGGGTNINTITGGVVTSGVVALYSNSNAFAALKTNGSVSTWGDISTGGNQTRGGTSVASNLTSGVVKIISTQYDFTALKNDGTVVTWGYSGSVSPAGLSGVVDIFSGRYIFAALRSNGSLVTWGSAAHGGDSSAVAASLSSGVVSINMLDGGQIVNASVAALKNNGSLVTWPTTSTSGGNSSSVASSISSGVVVLYTDNFTFAALKNNGSVIYWGATGYGGNSYVAAPTLTNIVTISGKTAYAALNINGGVVSWGLTSNGGNSSGKSLSSNVVKIYNNTYAFAALKFDGSVVAWGGSTNSEYGGNTTSVASDLTSGVVAIYGNNYAFAALKSNGKVITWGSTTHGGTSSSVATDISAGVVGIYVTQNAFAALRKDGKLISWGDSGNGGSSTSVSTDLSAGVVSVNNTGLAFAAITSTATTFDLSASYYTDNDRYDILRNKENRRRANLTTLNNNVFTLSSARDIERFNYTIPSGAGPFRIIIPDYVDSNYSIISTASIPGGASLNYIIACDESEPVTISGTTYINYGAFVYRRNADNTFTKMPSVTIGGLTYNAYGGDGINSSGIALRYRFGAFTVPTKTIGDASFNLTAPVTDSSGAFTYTSSNTAVATVTSGGTVTIVGSGSTTITATQAASGSWPADSITATLVVNKIGSTLGELTVPTKVPGDAPFVLTAPTSTVSSIISPVNTITNQLSIITPPALDVSAVVYGDTWGQIGNDITGFSSQQSFCSLSANGRVMVIGAPISNSATGYVYVYDLIGSTWTQRGSTISGDAAGNYFGSGVSISANGNIIAIAAKGKSTSAGQVRIYAWSGTSWVKRGGDIDGETSSSYDGNSGIHISLSADGTVVAIGANANDGSGNLLPNCGHVRVYRYVPSKTVAVTVQSDVLFGPIGWTRMGADIDGEATLDESGHNVSVSADGTTVAIGAAYNDGNGSNSGHVRVYRYNSNKTNPETDQSLSTFGPAGWDRLGADIDGEVAEDRSGWGVYLSTYGNTVAIGAQSNNNGRGHVRVYDLSGNSWIKRGLDMDGEDIDSWSGLSVSMSADTNTLIIGAYTNSGGVAGSYRGHARIYRWNMTTSAWQQSGPDIDGITANEFSGWCVYISADGTTVAILTLQSSGTVNAGKVRVFRRNVSNEIVYTSNNSSVADVCGNLLLIKGVDGTSTITASQTGNTVTGRLDVSGTTYTLQYNPFTYSISDASLATVSTYGTVTLTGTVGTSTITATQPATRNYASQSVTGSLVVSKITSTLGELTIPAKAPADAPFVLTTPTSTVSSIISPVSTIITTASVIVPPPDIWDISYGATWTQRGQDIDGQATGDTSGFSVSMSANGRTIAIGAPENDGTSGVSTDNRGHTRVYDLSGNTWIKRGGDIIGEVAGDQSGYSVSISANGNIVAIGAVYNDGSGSDAGHVRVYMSTPSKTVAVTTQTDSSFGPIGWTRLGADIDGEASVAGDWSGWSVSLSADGTVVAIGAYQNDGSGNLITNSGHVRVYKYTPSKTVAVTNQNDISFGPIGWNRLGGDIDGEAGSDYSGWSVNLSKDGTTVAIGAFINDGTTGNSADQRGHVRVYRYNASKTTPQLTNQNLATFGPVGWDRLGEDIDGEFSNDYNGRSVSLSADGSVIAIGAERHDVVSTSINDDRGYVRIFELSGNAWIKRGQDIEGEAANDNSGYSVALSADGTIVAIGAYGNDGTTGVTNDQRGHVRIYAWNGTSWVKRGQDIDGEALGDESGYNVALSSDGTMVAIGAYRNDGAASGTVGDNRGHVRVYDIATTNALTYSSSNSSVADVCGNLLLIKGVNGTSTITASQTGNTVTGRLDVSGTTYTLQYNPFTYTISDASLATVSTYGTVTLTGAVGTRTITATQPATRNYASQSVTGVLDVSKLSSTLGELTVPTKAPADAPFVLTAPTSTISSIISPVNTITSTASVIVPPPDIWDISYGATWSQLGPDILGTQNNETSGVSVSISADGTVVAIGSLAYDKAGGPTDANTNEGRVRIYKYNTGPGLWGQLGADISGNQANENSGFSVSLSADGTTVAIGSRLYDKSGGTTDTTTNEGRTRIYKYNTGTSSWNQLGADISGTQVSEYSGWSVSLSADGTTVAIGSGFYNIASGTDEGRTRIYKFNTGTGSWGQLGLDISGTQIVEYSGWSVSLSADGTTIAIGSRYYDVAGGPTNNNTNEGRTRIYKYNTGTLLWNQLGADISGNQANEQSGNSVSLSADGTTVAIGMNGYDKTIGSDTREGRTRIYKYNIGTNSWGQLGLDISGTQQYEESGISVSLSADGTMVAIGSQYYDKAGGLTHTNTEEGRTRIYKYNTGTGSWGQLGLDILGTQFEYSGCSVSLSSDGTTVAIGSYTYDKAGGTDEGRVRIYRIPATNALTYSSSNSSIADVCGNLLLIKGVDGTSTITASQTGNTVTGRLDVSGTTYTLQYNPFTYSISDASLATVSTYGTVTLTGAVGASTITATQPATRNYLSQSVTGVLDVSGIVTVLGALTIPTKMLGDASFNLTAPTSNNPSGAFTYTSSNTSVATVTSGGLVSIIGIGTTTITATQAISGIYTSASVSGSLVVNFGNTSAITFLPTDGASVIPTPVSNIATTYGSTWNQLGADTVGKVSGDESGTSISVSADGTIVAIGARSNSTNRGTTRVYKYNDVSWNQIGTDINGEASSDYSGQSVSLSANGQILAIGANMNDGSGNLLADSGHIRIYEFNGTSWVQRGGDIDGEANGDQSGISVSLSADGSTVAIGAIMNDGSGNALSNSGHVRVYRYNASKSVPQLTDQSLSTFGPAGWDRLGADIDGEAVNDQSGFSVSISANGTVVAIGANFNDGTAGTVDTSNNRGHVRVYRYNASKTSPQLTDQTLTTFGPAGWDRMGSDIDGEVAADQSGFSVSLSSDGAVLAIGSPLYDASGVSSSGRVRVFGWNGSSWAQRGQNINGITLNENVGDSVSISADGSILSVASFMKVVSYNYNSTTNTWSQIGANVTGAASSSASNITNATLYSPHVYIDATNPSSYNRTTNTWTNIGSVGGNVVMTNMGTFDASDNGGSFNYNGSTNYGQITVPSTTLTSITYLAVVKTTGLRSGYATIIEFGSDNLLFCTYNNGLTVYQRTSSGFSLTTGVWYVVAVTITSGGTITYYVNGVSVFTGTGTAFSTTNTVYGIGSGVGGNEIWSGKISALAVYHNRVLTASEIANVSNTFQTYRVSLSSQGDILAVGAREYDGATGTSTNVGVTRVYRIDTSGNYTYSSNNTAIADVCGNIILPKTIGSTIIGFTQSASGATASRSGTIDFSVSAITPTIGALSMPAKNFGDASFNLTAPTSDSGGAFTYTSSNTAVATVTSGGTVTVVGAGTTTITATQAATTNYTTGSVTASLVVSAIAPTIGTLTAPAKNFGDAAFDLTAPTSDSGGAFTYTSSNTAVATVTSGGTVTVVGAGTTTITATQAATTNYTSGAVSASLVVSPIAPTIGTLSMPAKNFGDSSFSLTAPTSDSGGAFTFTSSAEGVATVTSGGTVTIVGAGSTTITATQAATTNYTTGAVTASLVVSPIAPTIGALTAPAKNFGDAAFDLTAPTSNSGGDFTFTSSAPEVATVTSGGTVTIVGAGSTTITATQAASADGNYTGGSAVTASLVVSPITPTYQSITQVTKTYSTDVSFSLTSIMSGVSNSSGAYTFSTGSNAIDICGGVATILAYTPSAITITASQAASGNYNGAGSTTFAVLVNRKVPSYGAFSIPAATYEDAPFSITAYAPTTDSTLVPFTYTSSDTNVATITTDGTVVTIIGQGYTTITASQDASGNYSASSTTTSFLVNRAAPTFLKAFTIPNKTFGDASFSLLPFTDGLDNTDGTYHFTSSNAQLVSISEADGVTATIHAYTPTPITIYVAIDACGNYAASSTSGTLTVARAAPTIGALSVSAKNFGDASFNLIAPTSDSSGAFTYTSSNASVATVTSSGVVTIIGAGNTTITATQELNGNYTTRDISASLVVSPIAPTIGALSVPAKNFGDASFNLTAPTSNSSGAFTYTSSNTAVATVTSSGGTITIVGVGSTTITATQAASADGNYTGGSSVGATLVVSASLSNFTVPAKTYGDASFNLVDPDTTDNTVGFTFASSNTDVATLSGADGRTVTIVGAGSTTITASQAATANRGELTISASLVVSPATPVITIAAITKSYGNTSFRPVPTTTNTDTSGGNVFIFTSNNIGVVSMLDASLVRINGIGTATLSITQAASANFTAASGSVIVTVNKGVSGFSASTFAVAANKTYGDAAFAITTKPISSSTGAITYSSSDEAVATVRSDGSGNSAITLVGQGTVTFTASQAESALYTADTKTSNTLTVARKTATLSRDTPAADTISKTYGDANFTVTATNESNGAFSFASSDPSFATINASTGVVTIVAVGSTTLTATRAQTAQYTETSVSWTLNIARGTTTLTGLSSLTRNVTVAPFSVTASSASDGAVSYALQDPTSTVLTIHPTSGVITLLSSGSAVIVASQAQGTLYEAPSNITATITVTAAASTLQGATITNTQSFTNVDLSGASLANANITNTNFSSGRLNNSNFSGATISGANMSSSQLASSSLANATVTNTNFSSGRLNNANLNGVSISSSNMSSAELSGTTMRGATITGTDFTSAIIRGTDLSGANVRSSIFNSADLSGSILTRMDASGASFVNADMRGSNISNSNFTNSNMTNANISGTNLNGSTIAGANMSSAQISGSTMRSATITGTDFTSATMRGTDFSDTNVRGSIFNNADLSGSTLPRMDASGASFVNADMRGANLSNSDFTNANMTNANISGADITNVTFTTTQKIQLLKNRGNRVRSEIQVSQLVGSQLLSVLSAGSAVRDVPNVSNATFKVMLPTTSLVANETISDIELDTATFTYFYFPIGENEYFQIQGVKYYVSGLTVRNYATSAVVENITYGGKAVRLLAGSVTMIVNSQNTLSSSSFVVPSIKQNTDVPFSPTFPTSNSSAPIVYTSSNTNIATINSSTGLITPVAGACGFVRFTASQVATETHDSASITSNELFVNKQVDFTLTGLNQTFSLSTLASLDASSITVDSTDATAVFYVRLSDMTNLFQYQTDSFDVNNTDASDIKYYVFHRTMPTELHFNPSHAMMNKTESAGMLGSGIQEIGGDKSLVKHDFIRYIALRLFNTHYGVDLFQNEQELQENITYLGETVQHNIDTILSGISTTSASQNMAYDASGNKYLTNDASGNTNLSRELMRQLAASDPSRFYNNGADLSGSGLRAVPLREDDSINFKLTITAAAEQNILTGVTVIPSRTYLIKMVLKNTVNTTTDNTNTAPTDSEMYPNSYPYSTAVTTYAPTGESSAGVYNEYSPPAPIPIARFGYNGWYYANTTTWVNVAQAVRNRVKWVLPSNAVGSSTVADLRYIRMNLKVFNKTSLAFLVVSTQAGSTRKYTISTPNSLVNGTVYSFYMNFNSYAREPATIGATNAALTYSNVGSGSFADGEVITSIAVETENNAAASNVEFTLSSVVVGEMNGEKEYGFKAAVPETYP